MRNRPLVGALVAAVTIGLCSCGGRGGASRSGTRSAKMTVSVRWPVVSRLVPAASESIKVVVSDASDTLATKVLARPADGSAASVTIGSLPSETVSLRAVAYPNADGSGVAQAQGDASVALVANQTANASLTMDSTVAKLTVAPVSVAVGSTVAASVAATDASGAVVLLAVGANGETVAWTTGAAGTATVAGTGPTATVTGVAAGTTTLTATLKTKDDGTTVSGSGSAVVTAGSGGGGTSGGGGGLANSPWPRYGHDAFNTNRGVGVAGAGTVRWTVPGGATIIGSDGTLYTASGQTLLALDRMTGSTKWSLHTNQTILALALGANGLLCVGTTGDIYALDIQTHLRVWTYTYSSKDISYALFVDDINIGSDGTVYGYASSPAPGAVYALDGSSGNLKWEKYTHDFADGAIDGSTLFVKSNGTFYAFDASTGTQKWTYGDNNFPCDSASIGPNSRLYSTGYLFGSGYQLCCFDQSSGTVLWTYASGASSLSEPAISDSGILYSIEGHNVLDAIDGASGNKLWSIPLPSDCTSPILGRDGTLWMNSGGRQLIAVSTTARSVLWSTTVVDGGDSIQGDLSLDTDGTVYVPTATGNLVAVR